VVRISAGISTVTADGRRVVSASKDRTLSAWDLESGRALATLKGRADEVTHAQ
jgi:WD40 repeat protein